MSMRLTNEHHTKPAFPAGFYFAKNSARSKIFVYLYHHDPNGGAGDFKTWTQCLFDRLGGEWEDVFAKSVHFISQEK